MTLEIYSDAGDLPGWESVLYAATVDGSTVGVIAITENMPWKAGRYEDDVLVETWWENAESVETSVLKYGSDTTTTVVISAGSGGVPITSVLIYPAIYDFTEDITAGVLTLTDVPTNVRLRLEINGNRANVLHIFSEPLKEAVPAAKTDYSTLGLTVSSINTSLDHIVFAAPHGLVNDDLVHMSTTDTLPTEAGGLLLPYERYVVRYVDTTTIQLFTDAGDVLDFTDTGTGTHTVWPAEWTDAVNACYFPAGIQPLCRKFRIIDDVTVYIDGGAIVTGSIDFDNVSGMSVAGPGYLTGHFATHAQIQGLSGYAARVQYMMFWQEGANSEHNNRVQGITILRSPHFVSNYGIWSFRNVSALSPYGANTDGIKVWHKTNSDPQAEVIDCFTYLSDDGFRIGDPRTAVTMSGCFAVNNTSACYFSGYNPYAADTGNLHTLTNCHAMSLGNAEPVDGHPFDNEPYSAAILKTWTDGWSSEGSFGNFNVTITGLRVWGPLNNRILLIGNRANPWANGTQVREQYGQVANWTITDFWCQVLPPDRSIFISRDNVNTPHDFTFTDVYIAGTLVTADNYSDYFDVDPDCYNFTWQEAVIPPTLDAGESYSTVDFASAYHADYGAPVAWSGATLLAKEDALRQASMALDIEYGDVWAGTRATSAQYLDWPRLWVIDRAGSYYEDDEIPLRLQEAAAMLALLHINGEDIMPATEASADVSSQTQTVGALSQSVAYIGGKPSKTRFPKIRKMLQTAGLIHGGGPGWGVASS